MNTLRGATEDDSQSRYGLELTSVAYLWYLPLYTDTMYRPLRDLTSGMTLALICAVTVQIGCQSTVIDGLSEEQANQVIVTLNSGAIDAKKGVRSRPDGEIRYRVEVNADDLGRALALLKTSGAPTNAKTGFKEVFGNQGLIPTATEERARYVAALSGELERSLEAINGVSEARVHIALPETCTAPLDGPRPKGRASVLIKRRRGAAPIDEAAIRALVAGAASDVEPAAVAIVQLAAPPQAPTRPELVRVGPIAVARSSVVVLKTIAASALILDIALAAALALLLFRLRRVSANAALSRDRATQPAIERDSQL